MLTETTVTSATAVATLALAGLVITLVLIFIYIGTLSALVLSSCLSGALLIANI